MVAQREWIPDPPESESGRRRRERVRADIALRIERVCAHLSEKDLGELVDLMTDCQLRSERRERLY
jgi:hypothetical protein